MIQFLADHCFDEDILRAVLRKNPAVDFVLARDVNLSEAEDPEILAWAAEHGRVVITHDRNTMIAFAVDRIETRNTMAGLLVVKQSAPLSALIQDILLIAECTEPEEWRDHIEFVPL